MSWVDNAFEKLGVSPEDSAEEVAVGLLNAMTGMTLDEQSAFVTAVVVEIVFEENEKDSLKRSFLGAFFSAAIKAAEGRGHKQTVSFHGN